MLNHNNKIICNDQQLIKVFNEHYINIIQKSGDEKPIIKPKNIALIMTNEQLLFYVIPIKTIQAF